jgi:hypothetical protein
MTKIRIAENCALSGAGMFNGIFKISAVVSLTAAIVTSSPAQAQNSKTVVAGQTLMVGHYASVNPDCSSLGMPVVRLSAPPAHGAIRSVKTSGFSRFGKPFQECNTRRVRGVTVEYRPEKGFTGADSFGLDIIYASGRERTEAFSVTVK